MAWIEAKRLHGARAMFYHLTALHPETGKLVDLERSPEFDDQVERAGEFREHPDQFARFWQW